MARKLLSEDDTTFTFEGDNGKEIKVAKSAVSEETQAQIRGSMPKTEVPVTPEKDDGKSGWESVMDLLGPAGDALGQGKGAGESMGAGPIASREQRFDSAVGAAQVEQQANAEMAPPPVTTPAAAPMATPVSADVGGMGMPLGGLGGMPRTVSTTDTQVTTTSMDKAGKEALKAAEKSALAQSTAVQAQADAAIAQNTQVAAAAAQQNEQAQKDMVVLQKRQQDRQNQIMLKQQDYDRATDSFSKMEVKDFWSSRGVGDQVLAAISVGLGALGQGLGGGENPAMTIIQKAIETDMARQKANIGKASEAVQMKGNALSQLRATLGDEQLADNAFYEAGLKQASARIDQLRLSTNDKVLQANADAMKADISAKIDNLKVQSAGKIQTTVQTKEQATQSGALGLERVKSVAELQSAVQANVPIKSYVEGRDMAAKFRNAIKTGNSAIAVLELVANGLRQGSVSPDMVKQTLGEGAIDKANPKELVRKNALGGYNPTTVARIQEMLDLQERERGEVAREPLKMFNEFSTQSFGKPLTAFIGGSPEASVDASRAKAAGLRPVTMTGGR